MQQKMLGAYFTVALIATTLLLLFLAGFQSIWVAFGTPSNIMRQVGLQQTRVQAIAKDVLILRDEPMARHAQALSELQNVLPVWQQTQNGLLVGDNTLGLPRRPQPNILLLVTQSQSDYTSMLNACKAILAKNEPIDPLEADIVLDHEHNYAIIMNNVTLAWQQYLDDTFYQLYLIETGFVIALLLGTGIGYVLQRKALRMLREMQPSGQIPKINEGAS